MNLGVDASDTARPATINAMLYPSGSVNGLTTWRRQQGASSGSIEHHNMMPLALSTAG